MFRGAAIIRRSANAIMSTPLVRGARLVRTTPPLRGASTSEAIQPSEDLNQGRQLPMEGVGAVEPEAATGVRGWMLHRMQENLSEGLFEEVAPNLVIAKHNFSLGKDQTEGLTYQGLKGRMMGLLTATPHADPLQHPALLSTTPGQESSEEQLREEREFVAALLREEVVEFTLDTTMTVVVNPSSDAGGKTDLYLHSPAPLTPALRAQFERVFLAPSEEGGLNGRLAGILCPNLQHWLFVAEWIEAYCDEGANQLPQLFVPPPAFGEDVRLKIPKTALQRVAKVHELCSGEGDAEEIFLSPDGASLRARMLEGNPQMLQEVLFFHTALDGTKTLLTADSFYGGFSKKANNDPGPFARLWFKLTRRGSFRAPRLPAYRTERCVQSGNPELLLRSVRAAFDSELDSGDGWELDQILFAHGSACPFKLPDLARALVADQVAGEFSEGTDAVDSLATRRPQNLGELYYRCWAEGLQDAAASLAKKNEAK